MSSKIWRAKRKGEQKKNYSLSHARLCEKAHPLKAPGSVASFLRNSQIYWFLHTRGEARLFVTYSCIDPSFYKNKKTLVEG
jgi:hypothetical protein